MLLGLTGGYCAGKNSVAEILEKRGWTCVDVDRLGHEAVELARDAIVERFGAAVLGPDGSLDRKAIARIVFADASALADQEAIVHPIAIRLTDERIADAEARAKAAGRDAMVCVNAALLHRTELLASCEAIVEVRAPILQRIARGTRRDGTSWLDAVRRIARQEGFRAALYAKAAYARRPILVVRNAGSWENLERRIHEVLGTL